MRDYRHKIDFLKREDGRNEYGEPTDNWIPFKSGIWASMDPLLGNEFFAAFTTDNKIEIKFNMRFIPGVTSDMRIRHGETLYEILGQPVNVKGLNRELLCYCRAVR